MSSSRKKYTYNDLSDGKPRGHSGSGACLRWSLIGCVTLVLILFVRSAFRSSSEQSEITVDIKKPDIKTSMVPSAASMLPPSGSSQSLVGTAIISDGWTKLVKVAGN